MNNLEFKMVETLKDLRDYYNVDGVNAEFEADNIPVSTYCSTPQQVDLWFKAYIKAKEMCGHSGTDKRNPPQKEISYLDALVRGVYAKCDLPAGQALHDEDIYLVIPLQKGQISGRELMRGEVLLEPVEKDKPIMIERIDSRMPAMKN